MNMLDISYVSAIFIIFLIFALGLGLGVLIHDVARKNIKSADENGDKVVYFDYKLSKDYDRLYDLLNDGQAVLTRKGDETDKFSRMFYNSWKSHDNIYYLNNNKETIENKEKFVFYCKFKGIEFLDFVDSK